MGMGKAEGRIGGRFGGYSFNCTKQGSQLNGRLGGAVDGDDLRLELSPDGKRLWGRVGGGTIGKDLDITLENDKAAGRLGGKRIGDDIALHGSEQIKGRVGGTLIGFNCKLDVSPDRTKLTGRLGGPFSGADATVELENFSPILAAVLAVTVYKVYLDSTSQN